MSDGMRRVVITGLGSVTPLGLTTHETWESLLRGVSGTKTITRFNVEGLKCRVAACVEGFDSTRFQDVKDARRSPRFSQFGLAAAIESIDVSGIRFEDEDMSRVGVEFGSALGGADVIEEQQTLLDRKGPGSINPSLIPSILPNSAACAVSIRFGIQGGVGAPVAACATGTVSIGNGYRRLQAGEVEVVLAGGTDSVINPLALIGFTRLGACSTNNEPPERACAPFDAGRTGTVIGEGAAALVLETLEHARLRHARPLAEIVGYGCSSDGYHLVMPDPQGIGAAAAMQHAITDAKIAPENINWICAHGTATKQNDAAETRAIKLVFGPSASSIPTSSNKGALGHMLGAAGAISTVIAVKAIGAMTIPPTINYATPDPDCDLDYVPNEPRRSKLDYVLVNSFGFGGQNACLVLRSFSD